jgi:hypothetical protein
MRHPSLSPEHCTVTPNVKTDNFDCIVFSAEHVADRGQANVHIFFFAAANKMCCIAVRKSGELFGIANTEAGRPAVRSLAFTRVCRSRYQEDGGYIRVIHTNPADTRTAGAEWDKADGRSVPICFVNTDMSVSWE